MLTTLLRTLLMYAVILACVRVMGKRQISQLQTSELVVTLLISELAVLPIQNPEKPVWEGLIPMAAIAACEIGVSVLMLKSGALRRIICGRPVIVIEKGQVRQENMRKLRLSTEELFEQLRLAGVFALEEVDYAIMETNGSLSVLRHKKDDFLTPKLAGVKAKEDPPELVVVSDGELSPGSLRVLGKDRRWALAQLKQRGLALDQVFLMTARPDGKVQVLRRERERFHIWRR